MVGRESWRNKAGAGSEQALLWLRYLPSCTLRFQSSNEYVAVNEMGTRTSLHGGEVLRTTLTTYVKRRWRAPRSKRTRQRRCLYMLLTNDHEGS